MRKKGMPKPNARPSCQKKRSHKGQKCLRGQPIYYEEVKKSINLTLTPSSITKLTKIAEKMNLSRSEAVEQILRNWQQL
jgi:hypothetical protein